MDYIRKMEFSSFCLLACGAVVRENEALAGLEAVVERYVLQHLIWSLLTDFSGSSLQIPLPLVQSA